MDLRSKIPSSWALTAISSEESDAMAMRGEVNKHLEVQSDPISIHNGQTERKCLVPLFFFSFIASLSHFSCVVFIFIYGCVVAIQ